MIVCYFKISAARTKFSIAQLEAPPPRSNRAARSIQYSGRHHQHQAQYSSAVDNLEVQAVGWWHSGRQLRPPAHSLRLRGFSSGYIALVTVLRALSAASVCMATPLLSLMLAVGASAGAATKTDHGAPIKSMSSRSIQQVHIIPVAHCAHTPCGAKGHLLHTVDAQAALPLLLHDMTVL